MATSKSATSTPSSEKLNFHPEVVKMVLTKSEGDEMKSVAVCSNTRRVNRQQWAQNAKYLTSCWVYGPSHFATPTKPIKYHIFTASDVSANVHEFFREWARAPRVGARAHSRCSGPNKGYLFC